MRGLPPAVLVTAGLAFSSVGCADSMPHAKSAHAKRTKTAVNPFPSRDSLAKLADVPVAAAPARTVTTAPEWNVEIVPSDVAAPPVETRFAQVATKSGNKLTWVLTTSDLSTIELPPELLAAGPLEVAIEVTHHKPEAAAWGSYVVFVVMPAGAVQESAPSPSIQAVAAHGLARD